MTLSLSQFKSIRHKVKSLTPAQQAFKRRVFLVERKYQSGQAYYVDSHGQRVNVLVFQGLLNAGHYHKIKNNTWQRRTNQRDIALYQKMQALKALQQGGRV